MKYTLKKNNNTYETNTLKEMSIITGLSEDCLSRLINNHYKNKKSNSKHLSEYEIIVNYRQKPKEEKYKYVIDDKKFKSLIDVSRYLNVSMYILTKDLKNENKYNIKLIDKINI